MQTVATEPSTEVDPIPPEATDAATEAQEPTNGRAAFPDRGSNGSGEASASDEDAHPDHYEAPEPSQQEIKLADDVLFELDGNEQKLGAQRVIDALIQLVDVHKTFRTPEIFSTDDPEDIYRPADVVAEIARRLCRSTSKLEINPSYLVFYFKNHEKWTSNGQKVHGKVKRFDGFMQHHLEGMLGAIHINYHMWKRFNPRQKIFTVYRLLRELDSEGGKRAPDFVGYFEEPGLFGAGVHEEHCKMARAFVKDAPDRAGDPHQLSLMSGIFDED